MWLGICLSSGDIRVKNLKWFLKFYEVYVKKERKKL